MAGEPEYPPDDQPEDGDDSVHEAADGTDKAPEPGAGLGEEVEEGEE